jgi:hypothetical protein
MLYRAALTASWQDWVLPRNLGSDTLDLTCLGPYEFEDPEFYCLHHWAIKCTLFYTLQSNSYTTLTPRCRGSSIPELPTPSWVP